MKKMIMMMVAVSTLALGARAGTTVEWGLDWWAAAEVYWGFNPFSGFEDRAASQIYVYVCLMEGSGGVFHYDPAANYPTDYYDENFITLHNQLQAGTFDGTAPSIIDCIVLTPSLNVGDVWDPEWQSPTFFTDIPDGKSFGLLFLYEYEMRPDLYLPNSYVLLEGVTFGYQGLEGYFADGVWHFDLPGDVQWMLINNELTIIPFVGVPEPATGLLALAGIALLIRRKRK